MKKPFLLWLACWSFALTAFAQSASKSDSLSANNLREAFRQGDFNGSFRSFFMATDNTRQLSDYHAWATGGSLQFNTLPLHGLSLGIGGMFNYNLTSSDLTAIDSTTGARNRYEIGLFDVEDPKNGKDLDRLEILWLRYAP